MKHFKRFTAVLLTLAMLIPLGVVTSFAEGTEISNNWITLGAKYSSGTNKIIIVGGKVKDEGYEFKEDQNGGIEVTVPDYASFGGSCAVAVLSSNNTTPLDNLSVQLTPSADFETKEDNTTYAGFAFIWGDKQITDIAKTDGSGLYYSEAIWSNGLRYLPDNTQNGICVSIGNSYPGYEGTKYLSNVSVILYKDSFVTYGDGHPGYRWSFTSRNNTKEDGKTSPVDTSGIVQAFEKVSVNGGLYFSARPDTTLGYVLSVNGKEYSAGNDVAFFPQIDSSTYASGDIDLTSLVGIDGYLSVGIANSYSSNYGFTLNSVNGVPAAHWAGETIGEHTHDFTESYVEPSCTVDGYYQYVCTCGASYQVPVNQIGHDWVTIEENPGTCTELGSYVRRCRHCGEREEGILPLTGHSWLDVGNYFVLDKTKGVEMYSEWEVTTPATPTTDGVMSRTCQLCGLTQTKSYKYSDADKIADKWFVSFENRMSLILGKTDKYTDGLGHVTVNADGSITLEDAMHYYPNGESNQNISKITSKIKSGLDYFNATVTPLPASSSNDKVPTTISFNWSTEYDNYRFAGQMAAGTYLYYSRLYNVGNDQGTYDEVDYATNPATIRKDPMKYNLGQSEDNCMLGTIWEHYIEAKECTIGLVLCEYEKNQGRQYGVKDDNIYDTAYWYCIHGGDFWNFGRFQDINIDGTQPITVEMAYLADENGDTNPTFYLNGDYGRPMFADGVPNTQYFEAEYYFSVAAYGDGVNKYGSSFTLNEVCGVSPVDFAGHISAETCNPNGIYGDEHYSAHDWGDWEIVREPSCIKKGERVRYCNRCGAVEEENIAKIEHHYSSTRIIKEPNCVERGIAQGHCDVRVEGHNMHGWGDKYFIPATGIHNFKVTDETDENGWIIVKEPTETERGLKTRTCYDCGFVENEEIPSTTEHIHTWSDWTEVVAAKCEVAGQESRICSECNEVEYREIKPLGHLWSEWNVDKQPSYTEEGHKSRQCSRCLKVEEETIPKLVSFRDLPEGEWYTDACLYCASNGYMNGTSDGVFSPNMNMTRAQIALILAKLAVGDNLPAYSGKFTDVKENHWAAKGIQWAVDAGVTAGTGNGTTFSPDAALTRETLSTFFKAYAEKVAKLELTITEDLSKFTDKDKVSAWAVDGVRFAVQNGLISGYGNATTLAPQAVATRAQVALILKNFIEKVLP